MTKKDFELIAGVFAKARASMNSGEIHLTADNLMEMLVLSMEAKLSQQNPRFNSETFLKACEAVK